MYTQYSMGGGGAAALGPWTLLGCWCVMAHGAEEPDLQKDPLMLHHTGQLAAEYTVVVLGDGACLQHWATWL